MKVIADITFNVDEGEHFTMYNTVDELYPVYAYSDLDMDMDKVLDFVETLRTKYPDVYIHRVSFIDNTPIDDQDRDNLFRDLNRYKKLFDAAIVI